MASLPMPPFECRTRPIVFELAEFVRECGLERLSIRRGELIFLGQDPPGPDRQGVGVGERAELGDQLARATPATFRDPGPRAAV